MRCLVTMVITVAALAGLSACATGSSLEGEFATPVCKSSGECDAMWNGARNWLRLNTPYGNLRVDTEDRLVTHRNEDDPRLFVTVERIPLGGGRFRIEADIRCGVVGGCSPSPYKALKSFNHTVNRSYISFD